jgi:NADH dehydrogenase
MTQVLITGASGFIARNLAAALQSAGVETIGVSRRGQPVVGFARVYQARLGDSLQPVLAAERIAAAVHCALDTGADSYTTNVAGTTHWLEEAAAGGAGLQIFLSSLSAGPDALSDYGRAKYVLEQACLSAGGVVYRLGVVVGDGGMFGRIVESSRRSRIVPLLDNGAQLIYVLGIGFLCNVLRDCIMSDGEGLRRRAWNIQQPRPYTLRQVVEVINRHYGYRRLLLSIPAPPILGALLLLEKLPLGRRLPISSNNVKGLIQQGRVQIPSDFACFGYPEESLDALIAAVAKP